MKSCGIRLRAISYEMLKIPTLDMSLKIINLWLHPVLPGTIELKVNLETKTIFHGHHINESEKVYWVWRYGLGCFNPLIWIKGNQISIANVMVVIFVVGIPCLYVPSNLSYKTHLRRQQNCWSLRCSWSIACRRCSTYILILDLIPGFNGLGKDNCKTIRVSFKLWNLVHLILEVLWYIPDGWHFSRQEFYERNIGILMQISIKLVHIYGSTWL